MMHPIYEEPNSNKTLYKFWGINNGKSLPLLVTFSFDDDDKLHFRKTKLSENSAEDAYNQLKKVLEEKAGLLRDFSEDLKADRNKMFKELDLFDNVNEASDLLGSLINVVGQFRSATSI